MRRDAALILMSMGHVLDRDFVAYEMDAGVITIKWLAASPQPSEADINAAALGVVKEHKIASINAECRSRLLARYGPAEEQVSRSIGVYGATEQQAMQAGIAATIDASNVASNAVLAAADEAAVEAVSVSWPVI
jgi:hypothetical protein